MPDHPIPPRAPRNVPPLDAAAQLGLLRTMALIRRFELRTTELFLDGTVKGTAHSSVGQEAIAAGACLALRREDFVVTHHRGHGHTIAKGADLGRMMAELLGKVDGYCGGLGGSMHIADLELNILGANGIVGAGMGLAAGAALAAQQRGKDDAGIVFFGDGAANEGIFHEALNVAAIWRLPVVFFCENNQYGLSTASAAVTAGPSVAARAAAYGLPGETVDGNDPVAVYEAVAVAIARARAGEGPTLIEAHTWRWGDHSMRANLPAYRRKEDEDHWQAQDPIARCAASLAMGPDALAALEAAASSAVEAALAFARASPDPTMEQLAPAVLAPFQPVTPEPQPGTRPITYAQAITEAMGQEMEADERVFVVGEDVGAIGGIFGLTRGLLDRFPGRVLDTPISEQAIGGLAVGAALAGRRPIAEIQIFDFVTLMMDMIVNQAAKARFMLGGKTTVPVVFRGPQGGGIRLAAQHSQSLEAWFAHVPGLVVLAPSNPYDAKGLMAAAIRDDNPVVFLEHKLLYLGTPASVPEAAYAIPIGRAAIRRPGRHATIVATMAMVERALAAADALARDRIEAEVIDPRTLRPLDMDTICASVRRTGRCVVVHEAPRTGGLGAEIAAGITEAAFDWLDAPVARVAMPDVPMPYNDRLERFLMPSAAAIAAAVRQVCYR